VPQRAPRSILVRYSTLFRSRRGWFAPGAARRHAADILRRFRVRHGQVTDPASMLSGGNQQKLVFGREISKRPRLLVAAQPTRGVDLRGIKELQQELVHARDDGTAIVLVSQELDALLSSSDRVLLTFNGTPAVFFDPIETDARSRIVRARLGQQSGAEVALLALRRRPPRLPSSLPPH